MNHKFSLTLLLICVVTPFAVLAEETSSTENIDAKTTTGDIKSTPSGSSESAPPAAGGDVLEDRFNLNINRGQSQAYGMWLHFHSPLNMHMYM